jgi:hypothetical protein
MRTLYAWEITEARKVLGDNLAYDRARIHEGDGWPNWVNQIGRWLKRMTPADPGTNNAITLGYHSYFPVALPTALPGFGDPQDYAVGWLIHELTHAWQFQHKGWSYLFRALGAQLWLGAKVYDLDPPDVMVQKRAAGWTLSRYNMEQQATLVAAYYYFQRSPDANRELIAAYAPYVADLAIQT